MSLPDDQASTVLHPGSFLYPDTLVSTALIDYEMGGTDLNNGGDGLMVKPWACWADGTGDVVVRPLGSTDAPTLILSAPGITELSFAFDRNMALTVAYTIGETVYLYWYDAIVPGYVTTAFTGIRNPKLTHDDKRDTASSRSDVIFAYMSGSSLCYRQQRDKYVTEYTLKTNVSPILRLKLIGMNSQLCLQAEFERIS